MDEKYFQIKLPSKCLAYKDVDPSKLEIRSFKGRDEKLIAEINPENFEKKFVTLLKQVFRGMEPTSLTLGDELHLALWETINSYSKTFFVEHECEHCWQKSEYSVDLSTIDVVELPDDFAEPKEIKLPESQETVRLRLLRVEDILKVESMAKSGQNVWLHRYALSLADESGIFDKVDRLEKMSSKDLMQIRAFHDKYMHGPKMESKYECPKCGGTGIMPVPFRLEMLLPYGKALSRYTGNAV
jgi:hypothetical protein